MKSSSPARTASSAEQLQQRLSSDAVVCLFPDMTARFVNLNDHPKHDDAAAFASSSPAAAEQQFFREPRASGLRAP